MIIFYFGVNRLHPAMGHALNLISLINSAVYEVRTNLKATAFGKNWKMICDQMCKLIFVSHLVYELSLELIYEVEFHSLKTRWIITN